MINRTTAGPQLLELREKYKLTQLALSKKSGVSVNSISKTEAGSKPQSMTLYKLNRVFLKLESSLEESKGE